MDSQTALASPSAAGDTIRVGSQIRLSARFASSLLTTTPARVRSVGPAALAAHSVMASSGGPLPPNVAGTGGQRATRELSQDRQRWQARMPLPENDADSNGELLEAPSSALADAPVQCALCPWSSCRARPTVETWLARRLALPRRRATLLPAPKPRTARS